MNSTFSQNNLIAQTIGPVPSNNTTSTRQEPVITRDNDYGYLWGVIPALIIIIALGVFFVLFMIKKFKKDDRAEKTKKGIVMEIKVPRGNEIEIGVAEQMFSNLVGMGGRGKGIMKHLTVNHAVSFEIAALPGEIHFYVYAPKKLADLVEKQVLGSYQDAEVNIVDEYNIFSPSSKVAYASLALSDEVYYPLKSAEDFKGDPLANILSTISKLQENEGAMIQLVISPADKKWQKNGRKFVERVESNNSDPEKEKIHVSQEQMQAVSKKTSKIGYYAAIRIVTVAPEEDIADMHLNNIVGAFSQFTNPGINELKKDKLNRLKERDFIENVIYRRLPLSVKTILNVEELATIFHLPNKNVTTPNINWLLSKEAPAANWISSEVGSKDTIWLGNNYYRGVSKKICFERRDRRYHSYILGQTGSGKSRLMTRMMYQDIMNGDGLCFLDPHGSTAEMLLERIPYERIEDVIYVNAADFDRPFGFNMMEFKSEQDKHRIINGFIDLLKKLYDPHNQGIVGPILERAVRNSMLTAMSKEGSTLLEVLRILTDQKWVDEKWLPIIKDDLVKRYWTDQIAKTNDFHKSETLGYITSKFDRFVTNLAMRNIITQSKSSFDIREVMDSGKILIINLAKGLMGEENSQFLGLLIISKIVSAALSREDIPDENDRRDFFFYVDEFQNFATEAFASILSEARKYHLNLTVANQYIGQLEDNIKKAIFGNVGTMLIARPGPEDAEFLQQYFEPIFSSEDLMNQANEHYYVKLLASGRYPNPFSMEPGWGSWHPKSGFDMKPDKEIASTIKQISRLKYGRDVNVVTQEINSRSELAVVEKAPSESAKLPPLPAF